MTSFKRVIISNTASENKGYPPPRAMVERIPLTPQIRVQKEYPIDALGPILSEAARAIAEKVQVPVVLAAQSVAAVASLAAQAYRDVRLLNGQVRPISNFFLTIASSGDRKTSADREALAPVRKHELSLRVQYETDLDAWRVKHSAYQAEKRKIEGNTKLTRDEREAKLRGLGSEPLKPLEPALTVPEPTIEGLLKGWVNLPASLGLFSDEGGSFLAGHSMRDDSRMASAAAFSHLWDGEPPRRMRAADGLTMLYGRRLTLHLMCQPGVAQSFLGDSIIQDQGLSARFLIAGTESLAGTRMFREPSIDGRTLHQFGKSVEALLAQKATLAEGKRNELQPPVLTLSAEAKERWIDFYNHVEAQSGVTGAYSEIRPFASKSAEHAIRIAGVLSVFADPNTMQIDGVTMLNATNLLDWYLDEYLRLFQSSKISPIISKAQALYDWMARQPESEILFQDIYQYGPRSCGREKAAIEPLLSKLIEHGLIEEIGKKPKAFRVIPEETDEVTF